jgi:hypothetical protein
MSSAEFREGRLSVSVALRDFTSINDEVIARAP